MRVQKGMDSRCKQRGGECSHSGMGSAMSLTGHTAHSTTQFSPFPRSVPPTARCREQVSERQPPNNHTSAFFLVLSGGCVFARFPGQGVDESSAWHSAAEDKGSRYLTPLNCTHPLAFGIHRSLEKVSERASQEWASVTCSTLGHVEQEPHRLCPKQRQPWSKTKKFLSFPAFHPPNPRPDEQTALYPCPLPPT